MTEQATTTTNCDRITDEEREAFAKVKAANAQAVRDSRESVWFLKEIAFQGQRKKIITQNYNGPCSFIAICNILILRGDIQILPPERTSVSYEFLSQLVGEYLLQASPEVDISAALSIMPLTQKGMDLNPLFTSPTSFRPAGDGGALKLFEQANITLVHGWLVDPSSPEYGAISKVEDYDNAVNLIVEADTLTRGQLVVDDSAPGPSLAGPSSHVNVNNNLSDEEKRKIGDALSVQHFLDTTSSQLTYHGLFTLASTLQPGALVALFRGSHLSVLHKPGRKRKSPIASTNEINEAQANPFQTASEEPESRSEDASQSRPHPASATEPEEEEDHSLYTLVTDHSFLHEPSVVWERIDDVDGGSSTFVDAEFRRSTPVGGDFAGHTAEHVLAAFEGRNGAYPEFDPADQELARQLQAEEDARAHEIYAQRERQRQLHYQQQGRYPQQHPYPNGQQPYDPRDPRYQQYQADPSQQQSSNLPGHLDQHYYQANLSQPGYYPQGPVGKPVKMKRDKSCTIM